jgi:glycosyltransferase involved in cell wall biosynthesis
MMATARGVVSVLTPSLNQGAYIGDCLASVAAQTYSTREHIVFDGGSTDSTLDVLRAAAGNVSWRSEPDRGQADALNKALALSTGEFIGWLNADDAYADRRVLERAVALMRSNPAVAVVFGNALLVNERNGVLQVMGAPRFHPRLYRLVHYVIQPTVLFRRSVLERQPYFVDERLRYVMDRDLFLRLARSSRFARISGVVAIDRHQRARKVLEAGFAAEAEAYEQAAGTALGSTGRRLAALLKMAIRLYGLPTALRLDTRLDPAFGLVVPARRERVRLQVLLRRHRMSF